MANFKCFGTAAGAIFLVAAVGAAAHHLDETHLSSRYAPILKAALQSHNIEERARYIQEARLAVRTDEDEETEAKLEHMQGDSGDSFVMSGCSDWKFAADLWERNRQVAEDNSALDRSNNLLEEQIADLEGKPYRLRETTADVLKEANSESAHRMEVNESYRTCLATKEAFAHKDDDRLDHELRVTAGLH
jgi:hypothetical protein